MSTEIIAQIDFPTPFATLRFKCPAMCCSQTARTLSWPVTVHFPPVLPALPEIITQLAFLSSGSRGDVDVDVELRWHLAHI